jgi:hypothetical protein
LILDGTVVRVRLDKKATSISLLVALGVRQDGQKIDLITAAEDEMSVALTCQEIEARETYNAAVYTLQVSWHSRREKAWRRYEDELQDNDADYRRGATMAQRAYRDATSDLNIE